MVRKVLKLYYTLVTHWAGKFRIQHQPRVNGR
jgi:hypothetical protein